jgi:hypothetical protein
MDVLQELLDPIPIHEFLHRAFTRVPFAMPEKAARYTQDFTEADIAAMVETGRFRGRRAARDGLGKGRNRQTGGGSSSASDGSARVMSCPKARRATPVATRPQSVAIPRSMAGTSQCSSRPRPNPHPQIPPRRSPNTVTQPSIASLPFPLAMVLPSGPQMGPLPGPLVSTVPCAGSMLAFLRDLGRRESASSVAWSPTPPATGLAEGTILTP